MPSWTAPTPEAVAKATAAIARPEHQGYFFQRLENPYWVEPLRAAGWFKEPPEPVDEEQSRRYPPWPQSAYLARMAAYDEAHPALVTILKELDDRAHIYVRADMVDVAVKLPAQESAQFAKRIAAWGRGVGAWVVVRKLPEFLVALAKGAQRKGALTVLRALIEPLPDPESKRGLRWMRTGSGLEGWQFSELVDKELPVLASHLGVPLIDEFARALDMGLDGGASPEEIYSDGSLVWRPNISEPRDRNEMRDALITAIDRVSEILLQNGLATFDQIDATLARRSRLVFDRLSMNLLLRHHEFPVAKRLAESRALFFELFPFEYRSLLRERIGSSEPAIRAVLRAYLEEGPDMDQWVRNHKAFWGEIEPGLPEWWMKRWRGERLWALEHDPDMPGLLRNELQALIAEGVPVVERDAPRTKAFRVGRVSPVTSEQLEGKSPEEIAELFESAAPTTNPLEPSIEGLEGVLSPRVAQNPALFAAAADLASGAPLPYINAVFRGLRQAFGEGRPFDWGGLTAQCSIVLDRIRGLPSGEAVGEIKHSIGHLIWDGLQRDAPLSESDKEQAWRILGLLCEEEEPTLHDERNLTESEGDAFTMSLNATRGIALNGVMALAIRRWREAAGAWKGLETVEGLREILDRHLTEDRSLAVRSVYGKWFPWLVAMDPEWGQRAAAKIFEEGPSFSSAWNAYILFNEPYNNVLAAARPTYHLAIANLSTAGPEASRRPEDVRKNLGMHILTFYARGLVSLDATDDLLQRFVAAASPVLRRRSLEDLGRYLGPRELPLDPELSGRLVLLWESRVKAVRSLPVAEREELLAFPEWFESGHFEPAWLIAKLEEAVRLAESSSSASMGSKALERLAELAPGHPAESVSCLRALVDYDKEGWLFFGAEDEVREVLSAALAGSEAGAKEAADLVHRLGEKGFYQFRDLLDGPARSPELS